MTDSTHKAREEQMRELNKQFCSWVTAETRREPTGILVHACEDYIQHYKRLNSAKAAPAANGPAAAPGGLGSGFSLPASSQPSSSFAPLAPPKPSSAAPSFGLLSSGPSFSIPSTSAPAPAPQTSASAPSLASAPKAASQPASTPGLFGSFPSTSAPSLFGAPNTSSMFGAPSSQPSSAPCLFGGPGGGKFSFGVPTSSAAVGSSVATLNGGSGFSGFNFNSTPGASSAAAAEASPAPAAEDGEEDDGPKQVAGEVVIDGSSELLFKAVASLSFQQEGSWKSRGQGTMTVRRDTSKGLEGATSFVVFTTESGRILLSSGLTSQSQAKETARQTMKIMGVHTEGKHQLALLKFKSGSEAEDFANHIAQHRPKS